MAILTKTSAILFGALVLADLSGCARGVVYDEARDKQAQEAKRAAGELKIGATVRALEKGYADVTTLEVDNAKNLVDALREKELNRIARANALPEPSADPKRKAPGLLDTLEDRMQKLGAQRRRDDATGEAPGNVRNCGLLDCAALDIVQGTPTNLKEAQESFEISRVLFRSNYRYEFRTCSDVGAAKETKDSKVGLGAGFANAGSHAAAKELVVRLETVLGAILRAQQVRRD